MAKKKTMPSTSEQAGSTHNPSLQQNDSAALDFARTLMTHHTPPAQRAEQLVQKFGQPKALAILFQLLDTPTSDWEHVPEIETLAFIHDPAVVDRLLPLLDHNHPNVRLSSLVTLVAQGSSAARKQLDDLIDNPSPADKIYDRIYNAQGALRELHKLKALPDAEIVEGLVTLLHSSDSTIRRGAVSSLSHMKNPAAVDSLIMALRDTDPIVRRIAAEALGELRDARAKPGLAELAADPDKKVREAADAALNEVRRPKLSPDGEKLRSAIRKAHYDSGLRGYFARQEIGKLAAPDAIDTLTVLLDDYDPRVRRGAARALGLTGDARAAKPLLALQNSLDPELRFEAIQALGRLGHEPAQELLKCMLHDPAPDVREKAVTALGAIGDSGAVDSLLGLLNDPAVTVRQALIGALDRFDGTPVADAIITLLRDPAPEVRGRAIGHLERHPNARAEDALLAVLSSDPDAGLRARSVEVLAQIRDERAAEAVLAALHDQVPEVRIAAIQAVPYGDDLMRRRAIEPLVAILGRRSELWERVRAAHTLAHLKAREAVEFLILGLSDANSIMRMAAVIALGEIGDPQAIELLAALFEQVDRSDYSDWYQLGSDSDPVESSDPKHIIIDALEQINTPESLTAAHDLQSRREAAKARMRLIRRLKSSPDPAARPMLLEALKDGDDTTRMLAADALGKLGNRQDVPLLVDILQNDGYVGMRDYAAQALGDIGDPAAVPALIAALDDERHVPDMASQALKKIGTPEALAALAALPAKRAGGRAEQKELREDE